MVDKWFKEHVQRKTEYRCNSMLNGGVLPKHFQHMIFITFCHKVADTRSYATRYRREKRNEFGDDNHIVTIIGYHL